MSPRLEAMIDRIVRRSVTKRNRFAGSSLGTASPLPVLVWLVCSSLRVLFCPWLVCLGLEFCSIVSSVAFFCVCPSNCFLSSVVRLVVGIAFPPFALSHISIVYPSEKDKKKEARRLHKLGKCNWGANCHRSHDAESAEAQDEYVVLTPSAHLHG